MVAKIDDILTSYFAYIISILKLAGLWSPTFDSLPKYSIYYVLTVVGTVCSYAYYYIGEMITLKLSNDIVLLIKCACWTCTHTTLLLKITVWLIKRNQVLEIIHTLQNEEYLYEPYNDYQPISILENAKRINNYFLTTHYWGGMLIATTACLGAAVEVILKIFSSNKFDNYCPSSPFPAWIPLFVKQTSVGCLVAIFIQEISTLQLGYAIISLDGMCTTTLSFITAQFVVLQGAIKTVRPRSLAKIAKNADFDKCLDLQIKKEFNKCFKHLQILLSMSSKMESIYHYQAFGQAMNTLFVFCGCLYLVSTTSMTSNLFLGELFYLIINELEFALYCWFGNELTLASQAIPQALYESDWIEFGPQVRRSIIITMIRMLRPVNITVGKFTPLTLDTLVAILRGSYSFFALLQQVADDEDKN